MGEGIRDRKSDADEVNAWMAANPEAAGLMGNKSAEEVVAGAANAKAEAARIAEQGVGTAEEAATELSADPNERMAE